MSVRKGPKWSLWIGVVLLAISVYAFWVYPSQNPPGAVKVEFEGTQKPSPNSAQN